jgi:hypothetical protein
MKTLLALLFIPAAAAFGQLSSANPLGLMTYSFPATAAPATSYISVPLTDNPVYAAKVLSFTANTITLAGTTFSPNQFAQPGAPYFLRISKCQNITPSSNQQGRAMLIKANTANTFTVDVTDNSSTTVNLTASNFTISNGDLIEIFPGDTLASFFGNAPANLAVLAGGSTASAADNVLIYNKPALKFDSYFFDTTANQWRNINGSTLSANNVVLYPEAAIGLLRRTGRPAKMVGIQGSVPATQPLTKVTANSSSIYTSLRYPMDLTLGQLVPTPTGFPLNAFTPGSSAFVGDVLALYNTTTSKWESYYLNGTTWFKSTGANANGVLVPARSAVGILKRGGTPSPAGSYVYTTSLPYSF